MMYHAQMSGRMNDEVKEFLGQFSVTAVHEAPCGEGLVKEIRAIAHFYLFTSDDMAFGRCQLSAR